jgi:hypothetical protein
LFIAQPNHIAPHLLLCSESTDEANQQPIQLATLLLCFDPSSTHRSRQPGPDPTQYSANSVGQTKLPTLYENAEQLYRKIGLENRGAASGAGCISNTFNPKIVNSEFTQDSHSLGQSAPVE